MGKARGVENSTVHLENIEIDGVAGIVGEGKEQVADEVEEGCWIVDLEYFLLNGFEYNQPEFSFLPHCKCWV